MTSREVLTPGEVHLWVAFPGEIEEGPLTTAYRELLDAAERERHARFHFPRHRHEFLVAHALVRTTLSRYEAVDPARWTFVANRYGRPEIAGPVEVPPLRFNLSHTEGLVACAVTRERDVGVDVENAAREGGTEEIAERFFAPEEVGALRSLPPELRRERFFDYWTLKEAYIKARGMGLSLPLRHFAFRLGPGGEIGISFRPPIVDDPASWRFALLRPAPRHRLALAIRAEPGEAPVPHLRRTVPLLQG